MWAAGSPDRTPLLVWTGNEVGSDSGQKREEQAPPDPKEACSISPGSEKHGLELTTSTFQTHSISPSRSRIKNLRVSLRGPPCLAPSLPLLSLRPLQALCSDSPRPESHLPSPAQLAQAFPGFLTSSNPLTAAGVYPSAQTNTGGGTPGRLRCLSYCSITLAHSPTVTLLCASSVCLPRTAAEERPT